VLQLNERFFDKANTGMVFQASYPVGKGSSLLIALFYEDASFSDKA
jgi:hypothetical protein